MLLKQNSQFLSRVFLTLPEIRGNNMSLFQYFQKSGYRNVTLDNLSENTTGRELESIQESLSGTSARKLERTVYDEKDKQEIAKYTSKHGFAAAVRKFKPKFPNLNESTVRAWVKTYEENLKENAK